MQDIQILKKKRTEKKKYLQTKQMWDLPCKTELKEM